MSISIERVYEDHPYERVVTFVTPNRGRTIEVRVHAGDPQNRKYALDLYVVETEQGLVVRVTDDSTKTVLANVALVTDKRTFG